MARNGVSMYLVTDKQDRLIACLATVSQLLEQTHGERVVYKMDGEMCDDMLEWLQREVIFDAESRHAFEREYGVQFSKLDVVNLLCVGRKVKLANGDIYEIIKVMPESKFMYVIEGVDRSSTRITSWTKNGYYYTENVEDIHGRDIVEVLSA